MGFNWQSFLLNQFVLIFLTLTLGNLFGKIKFGKFKFGLTGSLFVGLVIGYFISVFAGGIPEGSSLFKRATAVVAGNIVSGDIKDLSLMIFIVGTGLLAAKNMKYALKKYGKQLAALAIIIPLAGMLWSYGLTKVLPGMNPYQVSGTFVGSLTSSAGLGAGTQSAHDEAASAGKKFADQSDAKKKLILSMINASNQSQAKLKGEAAPEELTLENTKELTQEQIDTYAKEAETGVGVGYSLGYPFGVLAVILAVNFLPGIFRIRVEDEKAKYFKQKAVDTKDDAGDGIEEVPFDFVGFSMVMVLGYALGMLKIGGGHFVFSLGSTGGGILVALLFGARGKMGSIHFRMDSKILGSLRTYFLSLFLAATGINYGYRVIQAIAGNGLAIVIISNVVAYGAILVGFLVGRYVFHINWTLLGGAITGGMTSAPGLGAAVEALGSDEPAVSYGATQPLATLMMVLLSIIMYQLPI